MKRLLFKKSSFLKTNLKCASHPFILTKKKPPLNKIQKMIKITAFTVLLLFILSVAAFSHAQTTADPGAGSSFGFSNSGSSGSGNFPTIPVPTQPDDGKLLDVRIDPNGILQAYNGTNQDWANICTDYMTDTTATILCRVQGLSAPGSVTLVPTPSGTKGAWVTDLDCQTGATQILKLDSH
jgi:hypothetical protein